MAKWNRVWILHISNLNFKSHLLFKMLFAYLYIHLQTSTNVKNLKIFVKWIVWIPLGPISARKDSEMEQWKYVWARVSLKFTIFYSCHVNVNKFPTFQLLIKYLADDKRYPEYTVLLPLPNTWIRLLTHFLFNKNESKKMDLCRLFCGISALK